MLRSTFRRGTHCNQRAAFGGERRVETIVVWGAFLFLVLILLAFDLGILSGGASKAISAREALLRTLMYFVLSICFTGFVYLAYENHWLGLGQAADVEEHDDHPAHRHWLRLAYPFESAPQEGRAHGMPHNGRDAATMYFTGYLVEQSLSMDNIFIIALILGYFQVPSAYQHRVLFWGIIGALVMRGVMIGVGAAIIHQFDWVIYIFGAILIWSAWKMMGSGEDHADFESNWIVKFTRRFFLVHPGFDGDRFFTRTEAGLAATPLFFALLIVESTDLLFAVDSIPAVFGITHDPFLVFTSNVFAILGLRSLYFALADLLDKFRFLKYSLVAILAFVGVKMLVHAVIAISPLVSLTAITLMLGAGIGASFAYPAPTEPEPTGDEPQAT